MLGHHQMSEPTNDRMVSFSDALKIIGISRSTAYRLIKQGLLPEPVKIGALTFFSERELQTWIAEKLAARGAGGCHE